MCKKILQPVFLTSREIKYILQNGKSLKRAEGIYRYIREDGLKYGVVVSKKAGNAAKRNLLKRRFREAIKSRMSSCSNLWIMIILYRQLKDYAVIESNISAAFDKILENNHETDRSFFH